MTIDELARRARLPVRTVREYYALRLIPPPERQGRVGIYGPRHLERLELIARLQRRGYSLAGIRDLLQAWAKGADLTSVLGIEPGQAALDEIPQRLTRAELLARVPALSGPALARACDVGLIQAADDGYLVRSPALLGLVETLRGRLSSLAETIADMIADRLLPTLRDGQNPGDVVPFLQRGRLLLLQAAASTLADRLGAALTQRSAGTGDAAALRAALDQVRVGEPLAVLPRR